MGIINGTSTIENASSTILTLQTDLGFTNVILLVVAGLLFVHLIYNIYIRN